MKTILRIAGFALLAAGFMAPPAGAEGSHFAVKGGFYTPGSNDLDGFDSGFAGEAAFGHDFMRNLGAEFGVGLMKADRSDARGASKLDLVPVTATLKAKLPIDVVELFAGAGMGVYHAKLKGGGLSSTDTAFGYHLAAGGAADLSQGVFLGAEFRYLWAEASFAGADVKLDGFTTSVILGYRF